MQITTWEFSYTDDSYMAYIKIRGATPESPLIFSVISAVSMGVIQDYAGDALFLLVRDIDHMMQVLMDRVKHEINEQHDQRGT